MPKIDSKSTLEQLLKLADNHARKGDKQTAAQLFRSVLEKFPNNKRAIDGLKALEQAAPPPRSADISQTQARNLLVLYNQGRLPEALAEAMDLARSYPRSVFLLNLIGVVNAALGRGEEAIASYQLALAVKPDYAEVHNNLGNVLNKLGRPQQAIACFNQALAIKPDYAEAHNNLGNALNKLGRPEQALASFNQALAIKSDFAEACSNLANTLKQLGRMEEAIAGYNRALAIKPGDADDHNNLGFALQALGRPDAAIASFSRALAIRPDFAGAHNNLGLVLQKLGRHEEAIASFNRALTIDPAYVGARNNLGVALAKIGRLDEAITCYANAVEHDPGYSAITAQMLHLLRRTCDWRRLGTGLSEVAKNLEIAANTRQAPPPFMLFALTDDPHFQHRLAACWAATMYQEQSALGAIPRKPPDGLIRIGYFSADFHNHATMYLMARLFEVHDRARFRIHAYSFGPDANDEMRDRLVAGVDVFHDVRSLDDKAVAQLSRREGIDIAVDLKGLTGDSRTGIFAFLAAPIQASYLGYPGTMGAPYMDYVIADPVVIPELDRECYSEKVVRLPHSYQVNDNTRTISATTPTRAECGLPESGIVFCCFNKTYKIDPEAYEIWMRLLNRVQGSVLWLFKDNPWAEANLHKEAREHGIDPDRIVFAGHMPLPDHLARHRLADLFLDTFDYNAHTTASDALWAGLPLVTRMGASFASRVSGSLLHALNMPELITTRSEDYEALALELAMNPGKLRQVKARLRANIKTAPLFDTGLFARNIEAAYISMYQRYQDGLAPDHLSIPG